MFQHRVLLHPLAFRFSLYLDWNRTDISQWFFSRKMIASDICLCAVCRSYEITCWSDFGFYSVARKLFTCALHIPWLLANDCILTVLQINFEIVLLMVFRWTGVMKSSRHHLLAFISDTNEILKLTRNNYYPHVISLIAHDRFAI